jgi:uncharacterized protein related to proFAR isomerase
VVIEDLKWNDYNRFNQSGYSSPTVFPLEENYRNKRLYIADLDRAEEREVNHLEFIEELKEDALQDKINEARDIQEEYILDDEQYNEGWI